MPRYLVEQIVRFLLLMLAVCLVTFTLVSLSPTDPLSTNIGSAALATMSEEKRAALASYWGVDTPFWERFSQWFAALLQGDLGTSLRYNAPVSEVIASRALNSLMLMGIAWLVSGVLGFLLGILAGTHRNTWIDRAVRTYCFIMAASPTFWVAILFLMVFAVMLGWFPIGFSQPVGAAAADVTFLDALHHLALPAITLSIVGVANVALHTREKTIDVMSTPYVRFARARGLNELQIVRRHGLRNLALPAITIQFGQIAEIFGGSVLVEQVFSYPGLGQAAVTAGIGGDVALLAGIALVSAALVFGGNLIANILYGLIDPRMRERSAKRPLRETPRKPPMQPECSSRDEGLQGAEPCVGKPVQPERFSGSENAADAVEEGAPS